MKWKLGNLLSFPKLPFEVFNWSMKFKNMRRTGSWSREGAPGGASCLYQDKGAGKAQCVLELQAGGQRSRWGGGGGFQWADQGTRRPRSGVRGSHLLKSLPSALQMMKVTGERPLARDCSPGHPMTSRCACIHESLAQKGGQEWGSVKDWRVLA